MTFAESAARLVGQSAILLGWRPDEFWRATPVELQGIIAVYLGEAESPADTQLLNKLKKQFPDAIDKAA